MIAALLLVLPTVACSPAREQAHVHLEPEDLHRIAVFEEGELVDEFGRPGQGPGDIGRHHIGDPVALHQERLVVLNAVTREVQLWKTDGTHLARFTLTESAADVALDGDRILAMISEPGGDAAVQAFTLDGTPAGRVDATLVLLACAAVGCTAPALRAVRIDPARALRHSTTLET